MKEKIGSKGSTKYRTGNQKIKLFMENSPRTPHFSGLESWNGAQVSD